MLTLEPVSLQKIELIQKLFLRRVILPCTGTGDDRVGLITEAPRRLVRSPEKRVAYNSVSKSV